MLASKQVFLSPEAPIPPLATELDTATQLRAVIGRLSRRLRPTAAGSAAGLTPTRVSILFTVLRDGPIRISELAEREGVNPTMLSRAIAKLADAGLIERTSDPEDRRAGLVQAAPAGRRLAERMRRERTDAVKLALADLHPAEREQLERALPALEAFAERLRGYRP